MDIRKLSYITGGLAFVVSFISFFFAYYTHDVRSAFFLGFLAIINAIGINILVAIDATKR